MLSGRLAGRDLVRLSGRLAGRDLVRLSGRLAVDVTGAMVVSECAIAVVGAVESC